VPEEPLERGSLRMDGLVVVAACVLLSIAAVVLYVSDVSISRAERDARRFDRTYVRNRAARHRR
jgi:hypothetical protein